MARQMSLSEHTVQDHLKSIFTKTGAHDRVTVLLREELEIVDAYLDVELLRMGGRLKVERCVEAGLLEAQIPPFLVQPLVENAVMHGIQPRDEGGRVRLEARAEGRWLHITVADTGVGLAPGRDERPGGSVYPCAYPHATRGQCRRGACRARSGARNPRT